MRVRIDKSISMARFLGGLETVDLALRSTQTGHRVVEGRPQTFNHLTDKELLRIVQNAPFQPPVVAELAQRLETALGIRA